MKRKGENIFVTFLGLLKVKHTKSFSSKYFNEHPHKYNLFGLSKMLSDYGISNTAIQINDKEKTLPELDAPFIAHTGSDFVVVSKITPEKVHYLWNGKEIVVSNSEFLQVWSGVVLFAEADTNSIEPNYLEHRKKEGITTIQEYLLVAGLVVAAGLFYFHNRIYADWGMTGALILNAIGVYVGYLLVLKQLHIHSEYADKICSLFKKSDCNDVLSTKASKLWGVIGWSEIGLGYFTSNVLIILLQPTLFPCLALINICALPYSVWSVWYQKFKAKQWCPLCLIVQVLFWSIFIVNLFFHHIQLPDFQLYDLLLTGILYGITMLMIILFLPKLTQAKRIEHITQEINSLRVNEDLFEAILKKRDYYPVDKSTSKILFGNPEAKTVITVLTNPHCNPCSGMHFRLEKLLKQAPDTFCVQYIFSSFSPELEISAHFLIDTYLNNDLEKAQSIYNEWFKKGKQDKEKFFQAYGFTHSEQAEKEHARHKIWREETQINATPTILINGYQFPYNYKIEDMQYFTNLNIDVK